MKKENSSILSQVPVKIVMKTVKIVWEVQTISARNVLIHISLKINPVKKLVNHQLFMLILIQELVNNVIKLANLVHVEKMIVVKNVTTEAIYIKILV